MTGAVVAAIGASTPSAAFIYTDTVSVDAVNYNVGTKAAQNGWNGTQKLNATVTINSGIVVGSTGVGPAAFTVPSLPAGSTVLLTNNGKIYGKGGAGNSGNGGTAISAAAPLNIANASGIVAGGGGGGGRGNTPNGGGGGGGQGDVGGTGGAPTGDAAAGDDGDRDGAGAGGLTNNEGGNGGSGGALGTNGQASGTQPGGLAGACTSGGSNINWISTGTRIGALN